MKQILGVIFFCWSVLASAATIDALLPDERNTVELFQKYAPNVVYVHRLATFVNYDYKTLDVPAGSGSGIIWDQTGHIVTNFHVIQGADKLAVSFAQYTLPATVVGIEPYKDLAVLKIQTDKAGDFLKKITPFVLAPTQSLLVGQKVIAIGNPFGLDHTLTTGVISALGRRVPGVGGVTIEQMIQTDTSINPGNSGGPLLDSQGQLVGLNTALFSRSGESAGVGFAIAADDIGRVVPQLIEKGRVVLAGIGITRVSPAIAKSLGIETGVLIGAVLPNTPAEKIGLQGTYRTNFGTVHLGDIIIEAAGQPILNYDSLYKVFSQVKVGSTISLKVLREGKPYTFKVQTIDITGY